MKLIQYECKVERPFEEVVKKFDRDLFASLTQGFPPVHIERFDGVHTGAETHLKLGGKRGVPWVSVIVSCENDEDRFEFVDEGRVVPFGITHWKHIHTVKRSEDGGSIIIDDVSFSARKGLENALWFGFNRDMAARRGKYKRYFDRK